MKKGRKLNFILLGRSGSGKGTQAKLLKGHFDNLLHVVTGDLFRSLAKNDTDTSKEVAKILKRGGLPFDDLATTLWMHYIAHNLKEDQGLICDGFPRRENEAKNLDDFLTFLGREKDTYVLLIDISGQEAFDRLTKRRICKECGRIIPWVGQFKELKVCDKCNGELLARSDDNPKAIKERMNYFEKSVMPTVNYYKRQKRLIVIDGEQPIKDVFNDILKALKNLSTLR
jgi:adenylate kinase